MRRRVSNPLGHTGNGEEASRAVDLLCILAAAMMVVMMLLVVMLVRAMGMTVGAVNLWLRGLPFTRLTSIRRRTVP